MPGLRLFTGNRLEVLAEKLAEMLRPPLPSPLECEIILVQSKGMERWVSMELAQYHGICANYRFPFPNRFVYGVFREVIPDLPEISPFDPWVMAWKIMGLLPSCLMREGFESLRVYLGDDRSNLKRFQLSSRIADLFDQYLVFRPEMILDWEKGKEGHWQAILWRELIKGNEKKHRAAAQRAFLEAFRKNSINLKNLPTRISVFGISALPRFHLEVLSTLSELIDVNLFLANPCREYWADIVSGREMKRIAEKLKRDDKVPKDLPLERGNSLLSSMGALGRDFFRLIYDLGCEEYESSDEGFQGYFFDPGEERLLHAIQSDILNLRERSADIKGGINESDPSIRIHSCHSPMREIEVLQDRILEMFEEDPTLLPGDILVMTPDIKIYAPFIQAVFSIPKDDPRWIPFSIADRGVREESKVIDSFLNILDLHGSRLGASHVLSVLESPSVRNKFGLSEADLELIHRWVQETGIRWGVDGESRGRLGLPEFEENTWRAGIARMLLGYAMPDQDGRMFKGILPYDRIEGEDASILGNFLGFVERLFVSVDELGGLRTLEEWSAFLSVLFEAFFLPDEETARDVKLIRQTLNDLSGKQALSGFNEKIGLDVIKSYLKIFLESEGFGFGFLTGGVTFCAMLPMRSIPFKVICLAGMNDDTYPRQTKPLGFDLMAKNPKPGDRSRRNDDRYLFLEAILSARERLYISYVGQSIQDNSPIPPSVLVSELTDYIRQGFQVPGKEILEHVTTKHRLQAFSPDYFKGNGKFFSYSIENLEAGRRVIRRREDRAPFICGGLSEPAEEWKTIDLDQLSSFYVNPAKFLLNRRLKIFLGEESVILEENEPFDLKGLELYTIEQYLVEKGLEKSGTRDCMPVIKAMGQLPQGTPGECLYHNLCNDVEAFVRLLLPHLEGESLKPVEVDLSLAGFRLKGRIENVYADGLLHYRYAIPKVKDRMKLWIHHLLLNLLSVEGYPCHGTLICKEAEFNYPPVGGSEKILERLLEIYREGLTRPLHFFPDSSWTYAESLKRGKSEERALEYARVKWIGTDHNRGEGDDSYYHLCFGKTDPLDKEFQALALEIFNPILSFETKVRR
jgi:exodeoxyribonuclease V gamma subunit